MPIDLPSKSCCYSLSPAETGFILLWIPMQEMVELAKVGRIASTTLEYYPLGLEIEVSQDIFDELGLKLAISADQLRLAYQNLKLSGGLPDSGIVNFSDLEQYESDVGSTKAGLDGQEAPVLRKLPEPPWTGGEDAMTVFERLAARNGISRGQEQ